MKPSSAKAKIILMGLLAGVLPWLLALASNEYFGPTQRVQVPIHEWFELTGACIGLGVALLLLLRLLK